MTVRGYLTIFASFLLAILLMIVPVPGSVGAAWPLWVVVVLIYWLLALPHRVGLWTAFVVGLWLDVFNNSLFGQHALALVIMAYVFGKLQRQIRLFYWWQQSLMVMVLTALYGLILYAVQRFLHVTHVSWQHWLPILTSGLVWPLVFGVLRHYRQKFRIM